MLIGLGVFGGIVLALLPPVMALWAAWKTVHRSPNQGMWCLVGFALAFAAGTAYLIGFTVKFYQQGTLDIEGEPIGDLMLIATCIYIVGELWFAWTVLKAMLVAAASNKHIKSGRSRA